MPDISLTISTYSTGTAPFTPGDDSPGNDSGESNDIVRVNDTVTYRVEYAVADTTADNLTWSVTFPKGMEITQVPGYCQGPGSQIAPATAGTPNLPLTANSVNELSEQTLTCNLGTKTAATDFVFVTAKVLNLAHQGQELTIPAASITADGLTAPVPADDPLPTVKASAKLMWDLSKNGISQYENSGYAWGAYAQSCPWDSSIACMSTIYPLYISAPAGGKGAMPAIGDITLVDDLSPESMYPGLSAAQYAAMNADLDKYGTRIGTNTSGLAGGPGSKINGGSYTAENSVRDSGNLSISQPGPGKPATINISAADMTLRTFPSKTSSDGSALPANVAYAVALNVRVYTPVSTIQDFGVDTGNSWSLTTRNVYSNLSMSGFDVTDHETSADQPGPKSSVYPDLNWNDYRTTSVKIEVPGTFGKSFAAVPGASGNISPYDFSGVNYLYEGPPGGAIAGSGNITVSGDQDVVSILQIGGSNMALPADVSVVACDAWDNTRIHLRAADYPASVEGKGQQLPSGGDPVWISSYNNVKDVAGFIRNAKDKSETPGLKVQYSALPGSANAGSECGDAQGPWYDSPEMVPGNDPDLAGQGIYTAVGRVRAHLVLDKTQGATLGQFSNVQAYLSIGMRVADTGIAVGDIIPNWAANKRVNFARLSMAQVLADSGTWTRSNYVPGATVTDPNGHSGSPGDRLIYSTAQARIVKQVRKGDSGDFLAMPPQVTGGDLVQYKLSPSLTSGKITQVKENDVWVEDCLPASQTYLESTPVPTTVVNGSTPSDAKRAACAAGETYIRWTYPKHTINDPIDPILLSAEVSPTAKDGVYQNTVVVWADGDASKLAQRSANAQVQISNIAGVKLEKVSLTPITQVNRPEAATRELNRWAIRLTNTMPVATTSAVSNPDVIDVLPDRTRTGSTYNGTFEFVSANATQGGPNVVVLYTNAAAPSANPKNASNAADGLTVWCDAPVGGAVVSGVGACPTSLSEVTAVRVQRPGDYLAGEVIEVEVSLVGIDNRAGDKYVNKVMAAATGLDNAVGPLNRPEVVVASTLGDRVWWDLNRNGAQDDFNGVPEPGAKGITVRVHGVDDLGNPVDVTAVTDASGKYTLAGLRASDSNGYTVTFVRPDGTEFTTKQTEGVTPELNSKADTTTGDSDPVLLGINESNPNIDAGLLPNGGLQINKLLAGTGVKPFAANESLTFDVACTFGSESVLQQQVTLEAHAKASVTSDVLGPLPAFSECKVTETDAGVADAAAVPVSVSVPWDSETQRSGVVTASLTNYYSAGTLTLSKKLKGDTEAVNHFSKAVFSVLVTCQVEEKTSDGEALAAQVYSGTVKIKGGQTKMLVQDDGKPQYLPLGAKCFGNEVDNGGADSVSVSATTSKPVVVTSGSPEQMQQLQITVVNTFKCNAKSCPKSGGVDTTGSGVGLMPGLALTGSQLWGYGLLAAALIALGILLSGSRLLRRRRDA
ncbi:hypothetical protein G7068_14635 [Leucobacter viscericola]|uniref:Uncharacterized protein n=1 Tax=Leucobacter viscericola TaxID=2714935 RepID=A0A6G7XIV3_9MICO|nr:SdrD B-like domain-containing protein [Leucobacter viscericola]QIK64301.1 hypothetical protein G7068_14635 [Leucobacter viscericola]